MMRYHAQPVRRARGAVAIFVVAVSLFASQPAVLATPALPGVTPCAAPEFQKSGEFVTPACGAPADGTATVSGKVTLTDRAPAEIKQVILVRKAKVLTFPAVAASPGSTTATDVSFEYSEPAASYQAPIDLVIVPKCGPILSISVDRPGRCN